MIIIVKAYAPEFRCDVIAVARKRRQGPGPPCHQQDRSPQRSSGRVRRAVACCRGVSLARWYRPGHCAPVVGEPEAPLLSGAAPAHCAPSGSDVRQVRRTFESGEYCASPQKCPVDDDMLTVTAERPRIGPRARQQIACRTRFSCAFVRSARRQIRPAEARTMCSCESVGCRARMGRGLDGSSRGRSL